MILVRSQIEIYYFGLPLRFRERGRMLGKALREMLPDFSSLSDEELVALYVKLLGELRSRGIIHSKNVLGDIGERLAIAHNKVMIIDGETVITGSFNFTKAAEENNAENLLVIKDKKLAERYIKNWQEHERHSEGYVGRGR